MSTDTLRLAGTIRTAHPAVGEATLCAHCSLPVPSGLIQESAEHQFCCTGCHTAFAILHEHGLDSYYGFRSAAKPRCRRPDAATKNSIIPRLRRCTSSRYPVGCRARSCISKACIVRPASGSWNGCPCCRPVYCARSSMCGAPSPLWNGIRTPSRCRRLPDHSMCWVIRRIRSAAWHARICAAAKIAPCWCASGFPVRSPST